MAVDEVVAVKALAFLRVPKAQIKKHPATHSIEISCGLQLSVDFNKG